MPPPDLFGNTSDESEEEAEARLHRLGDWARAPVLEGTGDSREAELVEIRERKYAAKTSSNAEKNKPKANTIKDYIDNNTQTFKAPDVEALPTLDKKLNAWVYTWDNPNIEIEVSHLVSEKHTLTGELVIKSVAYNRQAPNLIETRLNFTSGQAQDKTAKLMSELTQDSPLEYRWNAVIRQLSSLVKRAYRRGTPPIRIEDIPDTPDLVYRMFPILTENEPTILFGDGGIGKSICAQFIGALIQTNMGTSRFKPAQGNVMYLDYETSERTARYRFKKLYRGLGSSKEMDVQYLKGEQALETDLERIGTFISEKNISLLIVDSAVYACVSAEESKYTRNFFEALNGLGVTSLVIAHKTHQNANVKNGEAKPGATKPFGSIFWWNSARAVWELRKSSEDGESSNSARFGLYNVKHNDTAEHPPIGLEVQFHEDRYTVKHFPIEAVSDLAPKVSDRDQIMHLLVNAGALTVHDIASELKLRLNTIDAICKQAVTSRQLIQLDDGRYGVRQVS